jgi:hypothetical protein
VSRYKGYAQTEADVAYEEAADRQETEREAVRRVLAELRAEVGDLNTSLIEGFDHKAWLTVEVRAVLDLIDAKAAAEGVVLDAD